VNPFVYTRVELSAPRPGEQALESLGRLLRQGIDSEGRHYRLFGARRGPYVTMSLGLPVLGGSAPVLRAWLQDGAGAARFDVTVGPRIEVILFTVFWVLLTVLGGGYQVYLQLRALAEGRGTLGDVFEVLPGIGILGGIIALGLWLHRRRSASHTALLLRAFREAVGAGPSTGAGGPAMATGEPIS